MPLPDGCPAKAWALRYGCFGSRPVSTKPRAHSHQGAGLPAPFSFHAGTSVGAGRSVTKKACKHRDRLQADSLSVVEAASGFEPTGGMITYCKYELILGHFFSSTSRQPCPACHLGNPKKTVPPSTLHQEKDTFFNPPCTCGAPTTCGYQYLLLASQSPKVDFSQFKAILGNLMRF